MRVTTVFNRLLQISGASVVDVRFADDGVEVEIRPRARQLQCPCGLLGTAAYDRRRRRWRHLDLSAHRLWLVCEIRRLDCPDCGVRTEEVPWARPGARHTRDFEDVVTWLAQRTDRTTIATLMRCAWATVTAIIDRTVTEMLDQRRLDALYRIGVDEICYRHPHRYLTVIGNHDDGTVIRIEPGRGGEPFSKFCTAQPDSVLDTIEAVSMDAYPGYIRATETHLPAATICIDPFHVIGWANRALDRVYSDATGIRRSISFTSAEARKTRWALRTGENKLTPERRQLLNRIRRADKHVGKAWRLKEDLRDLYRYQWAPGHVRHHLHNWVTNAEHSRIPAFIGLARTIKKNFDGICNAVELGISNSLIEGINAKIRLINARGYGHHSAQSLTSMIYLNLGGLHPKLPTQT